MPSVIRFAAPAIALVLTAGCVPPSGGGEVASGKGMTSFASEADLEAFLKSRRQAAERVTTVDVQEMAVEEAAAPPTVAPPPPVAQSSVPAPEEGDSEQITNTQEQGVDEGGIVKNHGDHLVVLRRGRLFTLKTGGDVLAPVDSIDAFPPNDRNPDDTWYDEMLVAGDMVVVIGYSYGNGATEVSRFDIARTGELAYRDTHYLRSADYYSSRNYASRLIGQRLIMYAPLPMYGSNWREFVPAMAPRPANGEVASDFTPIAQPGDLYAPAPVLGDEEIGVSVLHTVTDCDLSKKEFTCETNGVFGGWGRNFYVSPDAVYVWTGPDGRYDEANASWLYRLPLDGSAPQSITVAGNPVDQFSFRQDGADGVLNVVVRAQGGGDAMWRPEVSSGDVALLRLPLSRFGDGSEKAPQDDYRDLPSVTGYNFQNRYVGGHLLYAGENPREPGVQSVLFAVPLKGGETERVALPHGVSRLDVIGRDGIAIGQDEKGGLGFSAIALAADGSARREDTYILPSAGEGENRSQAFFYRPSDATGDSGTLGLPVMLQRPDPRPASGNGGPPPVVSVTPPGSTPVPPPPPPPPYGGTKYLGSGSAILFLDRKSRKFSPAGQLEAYLQRQPDDGCQASCVDWYGNARPIFLGDRVFALLGYELVEGRRDPSGRIVERRRVDFTPRIVPARGSQ
ncbi:beta-propeller domain-containing protein [Paraurantiacibacter namhicola]|uniref:Beta propeller domain protein n=1 Tax=Paraurantiacibacter namhicola TaxID=645517 RepID=A0A1C7D8G9_9SPHN|nr:beta-propeller domain-containing protein [Paraurantiacibacter namhicola]ANU07786.1 Beta propeller domain protein [Paraurantiacibacter namhicola]